VAAYQFPLIILGLASVALLYIRSKVLSYRETERQVPALASTAFRLLRDHAKRNLENPKMWPARGISVVQLRDDVLHNEYDLKKREAVWKKVQAVVERNANVRASVKDIGDTGEVGRVWEWIGGVEGAIVNTGKGYGLDYQEFDKEEEQGNESSLLETPEYNKPRPRTPF
jgi:hypothetical protein